MGTKIPSSIMVHSLLAFEIIILLLKLTIALNLYFDATISMDQNGTWNPRSLTKSLTVIFKCLSLKDE